MFKLLTLQSFTPVYAVFTHCCRVSTICIPAPPDLLYSHFLAVRSRLATSFLYNVLSLPLSTAHL